MFGKLFGKKAGILKTALLCNLVDRDSVCTKPAGGDSDPVSNQMLKNSNSGNTFEQCAQVIGVKMDSICYFLERDLVGVVPLDI